MSEDFGQYRITGPASHVDVSGAAQGEYPIGTVQTLPAHRGDALVADGVAERVDVPVSPAEESAEEAAEGLSDDSAPLEMALHGTPEQRDSFAPSPEEDDEDDDEDVD